MAMSIVNNLADKVIETRPSFPVASTLSAPLSGPSLRSSSALSEDSRLSSETKIAAMPLLEKTARAYMLQTGYEDRFLSPTPPRIAAIPLLRVGGRKGLR